MAFAVEERAARLREYLSRSDVIEAMKERCDEQGHDYENCCSVFLQVYQQCKWCGEKR
jgi:hypothetical protein